MKTFVFIKNKDVTLLYETDKDKAIKLVRTYRRSFNIGILSSESVESIEATCVELRPFKIISKFMEVYNENKK
ncbi:MAG: hypothetical protein ACRCXT_23085 [Paraclostridium sp.]